MERPQVAPLAVHATVMQYLEALWTNHVICDLLAGFISRIRETGRALIFR
jgi:hypothetical protein